MTLVRVTFQTLLRAAAVSFLMDLREALGIKLQV